MSSRIAVFILYDQALYEAALNDGNDGIHFFTNTEIFLPPFSLFVNLPHELRDRFIDLFPVHRLHEIIRGAELHGLLRIIKIIKGREDQRLYLRIVLSYFSKCREPVDAGHLNVEKYDIRVLLLTKLDSLSTVFRKKKGTAVTEILFKNKLQCFPYDAFVIRSKYFIHKIIPLLMGFGWLLPFRRLQLFEYQKHPAFHKTSEVSRVHF